MNALPVARGAADAFDHVGLFIVPLGRPRAMPAAGLVDAPDSADTAGDWASQTAAENEGMPPIPQHPS
jgi:hypothetical protein